MGHRLLLSRSLVAPAAIGDVRKRPVDMDIGGSAYVALSTPRKLNDELVSLAAKSIAIEEPF
jgi:hypothetical protein